MKTTRIQVRKDICGEESTFFKGGINALFMVAPFWIAIIMILVW
ncbi:hypothetical protein [Bacillus cereus]|nr:hypothetical protein [Bacillus cereus]